jgi:hypothetical protein
LPGLPISGCLLIVFTEYWLQAKPAENGQPGIRAAARRDATPSQ